MKVIIDRFEGDTAIAELDGEMFSAPRALFAEAREGDVVEIKVIGRACDADEDEPPQSIFERLRNRKKRTDEEE